MVEALFYIHDLKKLAHRDLKTENIMIGDDGEIKIVDFGVSTFF